MKSYFGSTQNKNNPPVVTVFGGTGFLGRYVVWKLARLGYSIRIPTRDRNRVLALKTDGVVGQVVPLPTRLSNDASLTKAIEGSDYVINLIGVLFEKRHQTFEKIHAEFPGHIARIAAQCGVKQIVHVSALGADSHSLSHYAKTKAEGENALKAAFPRAVIMRPSILFGTEDNFINQFARMARFSPILPLIGGGKTLFQPAYVGDVAEAIVKSLTDEKAAGQTYALGGPSRYSFEDILKFIMDRSGQKRFLFAIPFEVISVAAFFLEKFPLSMLGPLVTRDQIKTLKSHNIVQRGMAGFQDLGIQPTALEPVAEQYLARYRPGGRFAEPKNS